MNGYNPYLPAGNAVQLQRPMRRYRRRWGVLPSIFLGVVIFICLLILVYSALYFVAAPVQFNILIMGLDSREGEGMVTRSDSIMLLGIDRVRLQVGLLSIPRDVFIYAPGYGLKRINTINVLGELEERGRGPELLRQSISTSFGFDTQRYIRLDFVGFQALVDAVGGVDIEVQREIVDYEFPTANGGTMVVRFEPGWQHMDGETALIYARTRHADDDYQRAARQQQVVMAVGKKLINPFNWVSAYGVLSRYTDTNMTIIDAMVAAPAILINLGRFEQLVITRDYVLPGENGVVPDYDALRPWINRYFW